MRKSRRRGRSKKRGQGKKDPLPDWMKYLEMQGCPDCYAPLLQIMDVLVCTKCDRRFES